MLCVLYKNKILIGLLVEERANSYDIDRAFLWGEKGRARFSNYQKNSELEVKELTQEEFDYLAKIHSDNWQRWYDKFMEDKKQYLVNNCFLPTDYCPNYNKELGRFVP